MKKISTGIAALVLVTVGACSVPESSTGTNEPLAQESTTQAAEAPATTKAAEKKAAPKPSSCDVAREAILTGSPAQIKAAMKKLQADKSADATAREYARYYLGRDAKDKQMQEMDIQLIQMSCSI